MVRSVLPVVTSRIATALSNAKATRSSGSNQQMSKTTSPKRCKFFCLLSTSQNLKVGPPDERSARYFPFKETAISADPVRALQSRCRSIPRSVCPTLLSFELSPWTKKRRVPSGEPSTLRDLFQGIQRHLENTRDSIIHVDDVVSAYSDNSLACHCHVPETPRIGLDCSKDWSPGGRDARG
jgi:hypothetical protein